MLKKNCHLPILLLCFVIGFCHCLSATIELVSDGIAHVQIVPWDPLDPVAAFAAEEMQTYLKKITGVEVSVNATPAKNVKMVQLILNDGSSKIKLREKLKLAKVRDDGYLIQADSNGIRIIANQRRGILYAVYHLLNQYGGVYWLYPGDEGEICPTATTFAVTKQSTVRNPVFAQRVFRLNGGSGWTPDTFLWLTRNTILIKTRFFEKPVERKEFLDKLDPVYIESDGGLSAIMLGGWDKKNEARVFAEHPEYFGMRDGKRVGTWLGGVNTEASAACQPCTSNPEVLQAMLDNTLQKLEKYGNDRQVVWSMSNDDHTNWCECPDCQKLDSPRNAKGNQHATRYWHYANYIAKGILSKKRPNISASTLVYQTFRFPPADLKPDPRVMPIICPHGRCYLHAIDDPDCPPNADRFKEMFDAWQRIGMAASTFEYHPEMPGPSKYLFNEEAWVRDLQYYYKLKMLGFGMVVTAPDGQYQGHPYGRRNFYGLSTHWPAAWQRHWLSGFYSWNIDADFETVSEKINGLYYGITWPVMKKYRSLLHDAIYDSRQHMCYGTPSHVLGKCYERPGLPQSAEKLLAEATLLAKDDPILLKRLQRDEEFLRTNWKAAYDVYAKSKQKEYNVRKRAGDILIDGDFAEIDWKEAQFVTDFNSCGKDSSVTSDRLAQPQTFVRLLYDEDNLYFAAEALKAEGSTPRPAAEDGLKALDGSHLEIFLTPPTFNGKYYHLGFSINGKLYQAMTTSGSSRDQSITLDPEFICRELADRWVVEARIPVANLGLKIADSEVWKINVARAAVTAAGALEASSWSSGIFHGSEVHRNIAFGDTGAILKNGDFEDLVDWKPPVYRKVDPKRRYWEVPEGKSPKYWTLLESMPGKLFVMQEGATSGSNFVRIEGKLAFFEQKANVDDTQIGNFTVKFQVRGRGELNVSLRDAQGKYPASSTLKIDSENWTEQLVTLHCPSEGRRIICFRVDGCIDLDNVRANFETAEKIPDAWNSK